MRIVVIAVMIGAVTAFLVLPAAAYEVPVFSVTDPNQDGLNIVPGLYDEGGDKPPIGPFPVGEQIVSSWEYTPLTACTGLPEDDPGIPNVLVTIVDINYGRPYPLRPLWYVADPETTLTNYDERVNGSLAFKIDNTINGVNNPLIFESGLQNNNFDPGETWQFIIQDFQNSLGGPATPFDSLGIAGVSAGWPPSTGSIIPEPFTAVLLGLGCLALLRRKA